MNARERGVLKSKTLTSLVGGEHPRKPCNSFLVNASQSQENVAMFPLQTKQSKNPISLHLPLRSEKMNHHLQAGRGEAGRGSTNSTPNSSNPKAKPQIALIPTLHLNIAEDEENPKEN